ncbi:hypothetical protein EYF80_022623 [Liparis tanakae]|uniref:Uncharacterized protein n=1 Tax=Liparis tanakae TaxID=230148 RepID=A0A4Z2HQ20_9TELE|nr:hypothetical protein EYF80_022623 [Liparis tanakae]
MGGGTQGVQTLTCSYRSIRVLSGSLSDWMACRTVSQWPLLMSATKLSMLSTVFRDTVVSSCRLDLRTGAMASTILWSRRVHLEVLGPHSNIKVYQPSSDMVCWTRRPKHNHSSL